MKPKYGMNLFSQDVSAIQTAYVLGKIDGNEHKVSPAEIGSIDLSLIEECREEPDD